MVQPIPEGFNTVSAYIIVKDAKKALEFYAAALGAEPAGVCVYVPGTDIPMHAEMRIGNSTVMLSQENPQWGMKSPETLGGSPLSLHIYVEDADAAFERAIGAGCSVEAPLMDAFWGDRYGKVKDPFGHAWGFATHKEDVPPEEMDKRATKWFEEFGSDCS